ncbi:MAG TPA: glycosyltransferase family 4 protein [Candidatus Krumholzibacterium sp.]|nr:glycosyltransferase family 4 protein [Candidatus Krumholzibacterium sp.]
MSKKRILMMINFFPPAAGGGVYRPLSFVKYLSRMSWQVTVVTPEPGGFWISDPQLEEAVPSGVRVIRTRSCSGQHILSSLRGGGSGSGSRRSSSGFGLLRKMGEVFMLPDTYAGWIPFAARAATRLCGQESFDAVYSTSPPDSTHLAAGRVARSTGIPWVADFRDPWIGLYLRRPPTPMHALIHRRMEGSVAKADRVIVTTDWQREALLSRYPDCRVEKIANGFDEDDFLPSGDEYGDGRDIVSGAESDERFTIVHCGMLTLGRGTGPFLEGLALFVKRTPEAAGRMKVVFTGARESANEAWVSKLGLGDIVEFNGNIPHSECVRLERGSHVLLMIKHDDERYRGLIPGKLFEYFGARRPVLAVAPEGEAASLVLDNRRGEVAALGDPGSVATALARMYGLFMEGRLDESYDLKPLPQYSRRAAAERLAELLDGLLAERHSRSGPGRVKHDRSEGQ